MSDPSIEVPLALLVTRVLKLRSTGKIVDLKDNNFHITGKWQGKEYVIIFFLTFGIRNIYNVVRIIEFNIGGTR